MSDVDASVRAGAMITDRVRLVRPLRRGGMGSVWVAEHVTLQSEVAVKFVSAERMADNPEAVVRFIGEASAAAQIQSPHVVKIFDQGVTDDGVPFIVMELLRGETLRERLRRAGAMDPLEVAVLVRQLCRALAAAHRSGIIHRDIKPDNLFLLDVERDPDDSAAFADSLFLKVLDFGLAKRLDVSYSLETSTGSMVGTPSYMSPEQALGEGPVDPRTDLWAAGVVAYHALTGEVPFRGKTIGSLCVNIAEGTFTPPSELREGLPKSLDRFFLRALATDPDDRYPSAPELARELLAAVRVEDHLEPLAVRVAKARAAAPEDIAAAPTLAGSSVVADGASKPARGRVWLVAAVLGIGAALAWTATRGEDELGDDHDPPAPAASALADDPDARASHSEPTVEPTPDASTEPTASPAEPAAEPPAPSPDPEPAPVTPSGPEPTPPPEPARDWAF